MYNHVKDWRSVTMPTPPNLNSTLSPMFAHGRQQKSSMVWLFGQQTTSNLMQKGYLYVQHMINNPSMHISLSKCPSQLGSIILGTTNHSQKSIFKANLFTKL